MATTRTTLAFTLSLHDALPISFCTHLTLVHSPYAAGYDRKQEDPGPRAFPSARVRRNGVPLPVLVTGTGGSIGSELRSEEHTSELQSHHDLVCRLLLEKKNVVTVGTNTTIAGSDGQPASGNGTSYSNPNLAGLIACLWQAFPETGNIQILDAVQKSDDH